MTRHKWLTGLLGVTVGCLGCSEASTTDNGENTGGSGGLSATGGLPGTGGAATGGAVGNGGSSTGGAGTGGAGTGGAVATGGAASGGSSAGGAGTGGNDATGGSATGGAGANGSGGGSGDPVDCVPADDDVTDSQDTGVDVSGTGPHDVVIETNSDDGIQCGTIYRPKDLGGAEKYPILVWGEGGCSQNGLSNQAAMGEIASWGYFVIADGTPRGDNACAGGQSGDAMLDYITWAIAQNDEPCSEYYQSLEPTKVAADGFSCGGLMAANVSGDPRFTAIGITSSGLLTPSASLYEAIHTPFKIMNGGSSDIAYPNGLNDYEEISALGKPVIYFSKTSAGHGGDLGEGRGDFNLVNLAWLNWQLKGDEGPTGKAFLMGPSCEFCMESGWDFRSAHID